MPDHDHLTYQDLTRAEQLDAKAHLVASFGEAVANALVDKNRDVLVHVTQMRDHMESDDMLYTVDGKLSPLNPAAFDFPKEIELPESHVETRKHQALKAKAIAARAESFLEDEAKRRLYSGTNIHAF